MASVCFTWVFLQAVLFWDIHCVPVNYELAPRYKGGSTGAGSSKALDFSKSEERVEPVHDATGSMSGPGDRHGSHLELRSSPPGEYSKGYPSPPGTSKDVSWIIPPSTFSVGERAASTGDDGYRKPMAGSSNVSPPAPPPYPPAPPGPEFIPGELVRFESTLEDGGYESETQEWGTPPTPQPPPPPFYDAVLDEAGLINIPLEPEAGFISPPQPEVAMPRGHFGYFYPYDLMFLTGRYPPGTYTHSSSSIERGRDDWQENHYLRHDHHDSPLEEDREEEQPTFPSDQSYWLPALGETKGPGADHEVGQQVQASARPWGG